MRLKGNWKKAGGIRYEELKATEGYEEIKFVLPLKLWDEFVRNTVILDISPDELIAEFIQAWFWKLETTDEFNRLLRARIEAQNTK